MRLLAFSDLHRDVSACRVIADASLSADAIVGAGDFATLGKGLSETVELLTAIDRPLVLIAGNHDDLDDLRNMAHGRPNTHVLHGDAVTIAGVVFFGLGFEIGSIAEALPQSIISESHAAKALAKCPPGAHLVTHAPPFGIADLQRDGTHQGSHAIRACIETVKSPLLLCGHIHNAWGMSGTIEKCKVHNLGPRVNWFHI